MGKSKTRELTEQVMELHKQQTEEMKQLNEKQTEEMKQLEEEREKALNEEKFDEAAEELHNMYNSYVKAGFTEEQAWELVKIIMSNSTRKTLF